jgi:3-phosphoshikimate 1-carboxyvinyltransferase
VKPRYKVLPSTRVAGEITVPGDKSISHRALMFGGIASGTTDITGFLAGEDCLSTMRAMQAMGVRVERPADQHVIVHGVGKDGLHGTSAALDMGNAGTAIRLYMGLLAPQKFDSTLIGDESLMRRPMERVAKPLRLMGARIDTVEGRPPVKIHGSQALNGIDYPLPVASAQVKSAVLLAGLGAAGVTSVTEPAPTRDHTERMLEAFGVKVSRQGAKASLAGGQALKATDVVVPADFSSAAFFLVAGALGADEGLLLRNVGINPTRTGLLDMLRLMGADIRVHARGGGAVGGPAATRTVGEPIADIEVRRSALRGVEVPLDLVPLSIDEFPVFFIAAACADGETVVRGAHELRVKESDRLAVMADGLTALGVRNELLHDGIRIQGRGSRADGARPGVGKAGGVAPVFEGGAIDSHGDHRIAMSFAVASLRAKAPIEILDVANVATSFPGFVELARQAGLSIDVA